MKRISNVIVLTGVLFLTNCASNKVDVDSVAGLKEAKNNIELAKKEGGEKYAPTSVKYAENILDKAAKNMFTNKDMAEAEKQTNNARFAAKRAVVLTRESKKMDSLDPEQRAMIKESEFALLREPLGMQDMRDSDFSEQFVGLQTKLAATSKLSSEAGSLKTQKAANQRQIADLESQKQFNAKFTEESKNFNPSEAEVVRKDNSLVLHLRAIDFPSGKSELSSKNYALLNKVQKTIKSFDAPLVTVEGHTDAIGSVNKNQELSLSRAISVKEYLVENNTIPAELVKTVGLGSSRPLASNETAEGRAENRRIDIIISPSDSSEEQKTE